MTRAAWSRRCTEIADGLFVGEVAVRAYGDYLADLGIDVIVSCMTTLQHQQYDGSHPCPPSIRQERFAFADDAKLSVQEIDAILAAFGKRTLLHCVSGVNRSQAIALCWLMRQGLGFIAAYGVWNRTRAKDIATVYDSPTVMTLSMESNVRLWATEKGYGL